ncbi:MAG: AsmA family protein [Desulfovibrio sp.]|nr:AsmA family protein [Desulfovibrio sp.]
MNTITSRRFLLAHPFVRIFLIVVSVLAAVAYALPPAATFLIGQEALRTHAQAALTAALERPAIIEGDVRLTMVPWFGLHTGKVTLPNDPGFGPEPLLGLDSATISLSLPALFSRRIVVDSISMNSATLNLERDPAGRENWPIFPQGSASEVPTAKGWTVESLPAGLRLLNATLTFTDSQAGLSIQVRRLNLNSSPSRPFNFSLSCEVTVNPLGVTGELHAEGQASYSGSGEHVLVHKSTAAGWVVLPKESGLPAERVNFSAKAMIHGEQGAFEITSLILDGLGARVTGQVNAAGLYEEKPYVYLNLAAKADRQGVWTKFLGMEHPGRPALRSGETRIHPSFQQPPPTGDINAELELSSTPSGWMASKVVLRDGPGKLSGSVKEIGGDISFDLSAQNLNLGTWLGSIAPRWIWSEDGFKSLNGRFAGTNLRAGSMEITDMELSARGQEREFRIYPFTAKTPHALFTSDIRVKPGQTSSLFSCSANVQALGLESVSPQAAPPMVELAVNGEAGPGGIAGKARLGLAEYSKNWRPEVLSEDMRQAWSILGGSSALLSFKSTTAPQGWEIIDLDLRTSLSHITGKATGGQAATQLDLQADRIDVTRLRQLAALFGDTGSGLSPWPLEGRIFAKKVNTPDFDIDDMLVAGHASSSSLKLSTLSGSTLGGKFSGGLEIDDSPARRNLSMNLTALGVHSAQLSTLWQQLPKMNGPLECRFNAESSVSPEVPVWQGLHGQADLLLTQGSVMFSPEQGVSQPWPLSRAAANLKFSSKTAGTHTGERQREAVLVDLSGAIKVDSLGMVRSSQVDVKGQAALDSAGTPLWYKQPKTEGVHQLALPFAGPGKTSRASWTGKFEADLEKGGFNLSALELNLAGVPGRAAIAGQPAQGGVNLTGSLDIPEFSPREVAPRIGMAIPAGADPSAWRRAKLSAAVGGNLREIRISRIQASLDDTIITGQGSISGARNRLELSVNSLDLDRLSPAPKHSDPTKRPDEPLPMAELRDLSLEAKVRFGWLRKDRLLWENAYTEFSALAGRFQLRQSAPSFYGGPYSIDIRGDARGSELKAQMELKLSNFSAALLLKDLAGAETLSKGICDFHVNVDTHGATDRALRRHATGSAGFMVRDGKLSIKEGTGKRETPQAPVIGDRDAPQPVQHQPTEGLSFSKLGASFTIREGLAITRDMILTGSGLNARGDGWVNLDDERIDLNLMASVPDVGEVPVRISGPLYDPRLDIDKSKIIGETIMNILKGVISIPGNVLDQLRRVF